jgi:hypothetical protein
MTEIGWPLIPREVLPAPVPAAKRPPRVTPPPDAASRQLPFFGAESSEPSPADLAGLLAGPGHLGRMGGTARVSVEVDAAWRVHVLVAELVSRGLVVNWRPIGQDQDPDSVRAIESHRRPDEEVQQSESVMPDEPDEGVHELEPVMPDEPDVEYDPYFDPDDNAPEPTSPPKSSKVTKSSPSSVEHEQPATPVPERAEPEEETADVAEETVTPRFEVLTAYSSRLNGLAQAWPAAAAQLFLSGLRLRLWVAAAGTPVPGGYALGLDPAKDPVEIDAALVRAGLSGRLSDDGRRYVIMGKRRLARLAELVGERPAAAPEELWPDGATA